jgi:hypothetical protein
MTSALRDAGIGVYGGHSANRRHPAARNSNVNRPASELSQAHESDIRSMKEKQQ